jgi:DNA-binding protein H-NS
MDDSVTLRTERAPQLRRHRHQIRRDCRRALRHRDWLVSKCRRPGLVSRNILIVLQANSHESTMHKPDLDAMQFEELWQLHEELTKILSDKIVAEKRELENRLAKLNRVEIIREPGSARPLSIDRAPRRKYPKVLPKYCNPQAPSETWSGRGKRPRWLVAALETGHRLDEFRIDNAKGGSRKNRAARGRHA